jgi:hypothetical protein
MKKFLYFILMGKICFSPLLANSLTFFSDAFDTITATNQPLSGFYSDNGIHTPQTVIFHDYNPESFSRVMVSFTKDTNTPIFSTLWEKLSRKLNITDPQPNEISLVIQRRSLTGDEPYDLSLLRPHYALFDIQENDQRLKGKFNASASVNVALFFSVKGESLKISNLGGITAHPGGNGSTVLSPNNLNMQSFSAPDYLFFSYVKTPYKNLLTLHYIPSLENHLLVDQALLMTRCEDDQTLDAFLKHFDLTKHEELEAIENLFIHHKFTHLLEQAFA